MQGFTFSEKSKLISNRVQKTLSFLDSHEHPELKTLGKELKVFWDEHQKQPKLTIAFIGQYNAGKSTIIKALTGDFSIKIAASICTDKTTEYQWDDVLLIDTPGVYAGRQDHDQITLEKIAKSDLLVFVVSNELFNPCGGQFFRRVANDMQRVGQMVLIINKMECESGEKEDLLSSINEVIEPYHHQDFYSCFIDADLYLKHLTTGNEKKIKRSNFQDFINSLQILIEKNKLTAKLITPLHQVANCLEKACNLLSTDNPLVANILEILRRKAVLVSASQTRSKNIIYGCLNELEHMIIMQGENIAVLVDGYHSEEEIDAKIIKIDRQIDSEITQILSSAITAIKEEINSLENSLKDLGHSALGKYIEKEIEIEFNISSKVKIELDKEIDISGYLKTLSGAFKGAGEFASKATRDIVYNAGTKLGVKFKPWGAYKLADTIKGFGPVIVGLGFALDLYTSQQEEAKREKEEIKLRNARQEIRQKYRKCAEDIKKAYQAQFDEAISFYQLELENIESSQQEIRQKSTQQKSAFDQANFYLQETKKEIASF